MSILRRKLPTPINTIRTIETPFGPATIDNLLHCFRFRFDRYTVLVKAEGDLLRVSFCSFGDINPKEHLRHVLWLLKSKEVATIVNPKFGNKPELRFSAAHYITNYTVFDVKRRCIVLPSDTLETALQRLNNVWYEQMPKPRLVGKFTN